MNPDAALGLCRFLHDASAMLLWGTSAYLWTLMPGSLAKDVWRRLSPFMFVMATLAVATTLFALPLEAGVIGDGWADARSVSIMKDVMLETTVGRSWQLQIAVALVLAATCLLPARMRPAATMLASGCLLATVASTGHAVMHAGWEGIAHRVNDAIHLLAAGAWFGALVPLILIFNRLNEPHALPDANVALKWFSTAGHIAVFLAIASGFANTFLILGRLPTDWSSPYQALLAAKVGLVGVMVCLALLNRYYFVPRIVARAPHAITAIKCGAIAEIITGLTVLILVAQFGMLEPV